MIEYLYAYGNEEYKYTGEPLEDGKVCESVRLNIEELPDVEKMHLVFIGTDTLVKIDNYISDSDINHFSGIICDKEEGCKYVLIYVHDDDGAYYNFNNSSLSYNIEEEQPPTIISTVANWAEEDQLKPGFISNKPGAYDKKEEKSISKMGRELGNDWMFSSFTKNADNEPLDFWYEKRPNGTYLKEELKHATYMKVSPLDSEEMDLPFTAYLKGAAEPMLGSVGDILIFGGNNETIQIVASGYPVHIKPENERPYFAVFFYLEDPLEIDNIQMGILATFNKEEGFLNVMSFDEYTNYTFSYDCAAPVALPQKYVPNADWAQYEESGEGYIKNKIGGYKTLQEVDPIIVEFDDREGHTIEEVMAQYPDFIGTNHNFKQEFIDATEIKVLQSTGYEYSIYRQPGVFNYMGYKAVVFGYNENLLWHITTIADQLPIKTQTDYMIVILGGEPLTTSSVIHAYGYMDWEEEETEDIFYDGDTITYVTALPVPYTQAYTPNADWNQNDPEGEGYIKNRPGIYDSTEMVTRFTSTCTSIQTTSTTVNDNFSNVKDYYFEDLFVEGAVAQLTVGDVVFPKTTVRIVNDTPYIGNAYGAIEHAINTGENYALIYHSIGIGSSIVLHYVEGKSTSWVVDGADISLAIEQDKFNKIPAKYLSPTADWNESNVNSTGYIANKVGMYSEYETAEFSGIINSQGANKQTNNFTTLFVPGSTAQLTVGDTVFPSTEIKLFNGTTPYIGNNASRGGTDTGEIYACYYNAIGVPASMQPEKINGKDQSWWVAGANWKITVTKETIHKVPKKYSSEPDMDAAVGEEGYIKNKHGGYSNIVNKELYTATLSVVSTSQSLTNYSADSSFTNRFVVGQKVTLVVGNKIFKETEIKQSGDYLMFGNASSRGGTDTGESYAIWYNSPTAGPASLALIKIDGKDDGSWCVDGANVSILFKTEEVHKYEPKYLPMINVYFYKDNGTLKCNHTYQDIEAVENIANHEGIIDATYWVGLNYGNYTYYKCVEIGWYSSGDGEWYRFHFISVSSDKTIDQYKGVSVYADGRITES